MDPGWKINLIQTKQEAFPEKIELDSLVNLVINGLDDQKPIFRNLPEEKMTYLYAKTTKYTKKDQWYLDFYLRQKGGLVIFCKAKKLSIKNNRSKLSSDIKSFRKFKDITTSHSCLSCVKPTE